MCGTSFEDASSCERPCPSGSSSECPFGESCFTHTTCEAPTPAQEPTASPDSYFCGTSFLDASTQCTEPCPTMLDSECPDGQQCYANTSCDREAYCGATYEEASTTCTLPCASGSSNDCPIGTQCFPMTSCGKSDSFFCGTTFDDASASCSFPCPMGLSSECPDGLGCFPYTSCDASSSETPLEPLDSYFCGKTYDDATVCLVVVNFSVVYVLAANACFTRIRYAASVKEISSFL